MRFSEKCGSDKLTASERRIVRAFIPFSLHTVETICKAVGLTTDAAYKALERLVWAKWLITAKATGRQNYWTLSDRAIAALGLPRRNDRRLTLPGLIQGFGVVYSCQKLGLENLTADQIREEYPSLIGKGAPAGSHAKDSEGRLYVVTVNHRARARSVAQKVVKNIIGLRYDSPDFHDLLDRGMYGVVIAIPSREKAAEVRVELDRIGPDERVIIRLAVVTQLAQFLIN